MNVIFCKFRIKEKQTKNQGCRTGDPYPPAPYFFPSHPPRPAHFPLHPPRLARKIFVSPAPPRDFFPSPAPPRFKSPAHVFLIQIINKD